MLGRGVMSELKSMSGTATALKRVRLQESDPDSAVMPIRLPKRLAYRPSVPTAELKRIVFRVVRERQAKEREAALNAKSQSTDLH